MSERSSKLTILTIFIAVIVVLEFEMFLAYTPGVGTAIQDGLEIDMGDLLFSLTSFITLLISIITVVITILKGETATKIISIVGLIVIILFLIQIVVGFLAMMQFI